MQNPQIKSPQEGRTAALNKVDGGLPIQISRKRTRSKISPRKEFIEQNRLRLNYERKFRGQLQTLFTRTGREASKQYISSGTLGKTYQDFSGKLADLLTSHYRAVIDAFGLRILRDRKQESQFETIIRQYVRDVGGVRITQISGSTMKQINRVIDNGVKEGLGVAVIGKGIRETMDSPFTRYRANTIARTETHSAAGYANHQVNASFNIPDQVKRWVSVSDARSRATHVSANGTEVPLDEDFIVGGVAMGYTGDPKGGAKNVINCRCVTLYIDPEEEVIQDENTVVAQKPVATNQPYGEATANEIEFHDQGGWNKASKVFKVIALTRPVETIRERERGFYRKNRKGSSEVPQINMPTAADQLRAGTAIGLREKTTWRHEYGHHIDYMMGRHLRNSASEIGISADLKATVIADRKLHRSPKLKQKDAEAEASILAFLKTRGLDIDPKEFANRPSFYSYRQWLATDRATPDGDFDTVMEFLEFDKDTINEILKGSGFDYDDVVILFGDGINGKGQARTGGAVGLLNNANESKGAKRDFLFFLNDLKVNRVGQGNNNQGWSAWLERNSHMDEGGYLADYMEAMSNAAIGRGHGKSYYSKFVSLGDGIRMSHTTEMMANYTALMGTDPKRAAVYRRLIERVAPESLKKMDELFDEMLEGGKMPDDI